VLPFEAFGDNDDIGLIAASVTGELIENLMLFQDFRVYSTASSFRQDADADPDILGRDLGVSFVVTGVMQSQNGQVRLRARLVDTQTGEVRWSGSYDEPLTPGDLLGAQHDLAVAISTELGEPYGVVNEAIGRRMARDSAPSMPSYACILRAYDYRRTFQDALFAPALACLKQAVVRDPDYADAWAMLGWLHLDAVRNDIAPEADRPAEMAAAFEAASHAVDLDRGSQRALEALAAVTFYRNDYAAAEVLQREVLALNPHHPDILAQLGWRMAVRGDREGLAYLEQAVARSADPPGWYYHLIAVYAYLDGEYARALAAAEKSARFGSAVGLSLAAMSHAKLGDTETARAELAAMAEAWPLLGRDPAAAYRMHHPTDAIVEALVEGLRAAGWAAPDEASP
jgi:TolB-like protein/tetratricopeptide (TPR) repeat protein